MGLSSIKGGLHVTTHTGPGPQSVALLQPYPFTVNGLCFKQWHNGHSMGGHADGTLVACRSHLSLRSKQSVCHP